MAARVELRKISNGEGDGLLGIVRGSSGSVVTWRRAQIVLLADTDPNGNRIAKICNWLGIEKKKSPNRFSDASQGCGISGTGPGGQNPGQKPAISRRAKPMVRETKEPRRTGFDLQGQRFVAPSRLVA